MAEQRPVKAPDAGSTPAQFANRDSDRIPQTVTLAEHPRHQAVALARRVRLPHVTPMGR